MANTNIKLPNPVGYTRGLPFQFINWVQLLFSRVGEGPFKVKGYSKSTLPSASEWQGDNDFTSLIYVYDETGGGTVAFSDGTNWRRVQDRAIVS